MRLPKIKRRHRPTRARAGFSILEAMVAAAVLGIGLVGLVRLHMASIKSMQRGRDVNIAEDIATQAAEEMAALGGAALSLNTVGVGRCNINVAPTGCRLLNGGTGVITTSFTTARLAPCTQWVREQGNTRDASGAEPASITTEATALAAGRRYRVDRMITAHPAVTQNATTRVVDVFVCWRDDSNVVHEVRASRVVL